MPWGEDAEAGTMKTIRYVKGQRQPGQGGRRNPPGGRPTEERAAEKESFRRSLGAQAGREGAEELAGAYYDAWL